MSNGPPRPPYGSPYAAPPGAQPPYGGAPQQGYGPPPAPQAYPPQQGYGPPPAQPPYGGGPPPVYGPPQAGQHPYAVPSQGMQPPAPAAPGAYGDAAGEHRRMKRGRYGAWVYVVLAFLGEAALLGAIPGSLLGFAAGAAGAPKQATGLIVLTGIFVLGLPLAYLVFRDRWRCNEAFSSRFCVGLMNVSILFVPMIALGYANVRGFQKLTGK